MNEMKSTRSAMVVKVPMVSVASDPNEMSPGPSCECDRKCQDSYQLNLSQKRHREEDVGDYEREAVTCGGRC